MGLLVGFCLNRINIIVKSGWRGRIEQNKERLKDEVRFVLRPCEPPFGELQAKDLPMQAARVLLLTEGPYHRAFIDGTTGEMNFVYSALDFEFRWISLSFLMQNGTFIFNLMYLAFSLQGLFQSPIFYSFHLLDMIVSTTASFTHFLSCTRIDSLSCRTLSRVSPRTASSSA